MRSLRRLWPVWLLLPAVLLVLVWNDVLPGGWRLRGWVTPHAVREARRQAEHSARRLLGFARENPAVPTGATVWLGSSTIERFPLAELLTGGPHVNRGVGGESAPELLDRVERSLPPARPERLVFYVGSIDLRHHGRSPARIEATAELVVDVALQRYGDGEGDGDRIGVGLLGLLPERDMEEELAARLVATNRRLAALCQRRGWRFLDPNRPPLLLEGRGLNPELAADRLHLDRDGYEVLAGWMEEEGFLER